MSRGHLIAILYSVYTFYHRGGRFTRGLWSGVTEAGWLMIIATSIMGLSGVDIQWSLHHQIFALMLMVLLVALLSLVFRRRPVLVVNRRCPKFATAGVDFHCSVTVSNEGRRAHHVLQLQEWLADIPPTREEFVNRPEPREAERNVFDRIFVYYRWRWLLDTKRLANGFTSERFPLGPGETRRVMLRLRPNRRGILRLGRLMVLRQDPFGLFRRGLRVGSGWNSILVLPKRYPIPRMELRGRTELDDSGAGGVRTSVGLSHEFVGLRDYRPGDPPRHIHWRSWARLNRPVVKEYEEEHYPRYALALDTVLGWEQDPEIFEEAVSVAASFVSAVETREAVLDFLFVADQSYCFSMGGPGASRASEKMLEVLATVEWQTDPAVLEGLRSSVLRRAAGLSAAVLVLTGWCEERRQLVQALRSGDVHCVVLVISEERRQSQPGLHFLPLGEVAAGLASLELSLERSPLQAS